MLSINNLKEMKKLFYLILGLGLVSLPSQATHKQGKKVSLKQVKHSPAEQALRNEKKAASGSGLAIRTRSERTVQRTATPNSTQSTLVYQDLGGSVNPFTAIGDNRNYVSVVPELNLLALFRRGGVGDGGNTPGNKLFYDLNTKGGAEGQWQVSRGRLFTNEIYPVTATNNYGPRYPQGLLFNPPGNTDTNEVRAMAFTRVLDGSNDTWGGYGKGSQKLAAGSPATQSLWSSGDVNHFRLGSVVSTSQGAIFTIEPEETVSGSTVTFTDRIMIYRYKYNSTTQSFDSTTTFLPLANAQADSASAVGGAEIAFGPDGLHGVAVVAAYQKDITPNFALYPFVARTTNGGETWSDWTVLNFNVRPSEFGQTNPCKDAFRDSLFVGNYVTFTDTSIVRADSATQPFAHPVDYTMLTFDLTVDRNNTAHILTTLYVAGFGDTLEITGPTFFRPQNGGWLVDIMLKQNDSLGRGLFLKEMAGVQGCWGDCDTEENIEELNRPMISRSADGEFLSFVWLDTDQEAHPQLTDNNNSNPDLFIRNMKVNADGSMGLTQTDENLSAGTDFDGRFICMSVSPILLDKGTVYETPSTHLALGDLVGTSADWPCTHVYTSGIEVSKNAADYPVFVQEPCILTETKKQLPGNLTAKTAMTIYPNPTVGSEFSVNLSNLEPGKVTMELFNSQGQLISSKQVESIGGNINIPFKVKNGVSGIHQLRIRTRHSTLGQKIQVQP